MELFLRPVGARAKNVARFSARALRATFWCL
jgi:hypothetical protein